MLPAARGNQSVGTRLLDLAPSYISYGLSFAVIAVSWAAHYDTFRYVRRVDGWLIMLNFASLLLIAVLPFPTAVLGHNETDPAAAVLNASTIALTGVTSAAIWLYATWDRRLVDPTLLTRSCVGACCYRWLAPWCSFYRSRLPCGGRKSPKSRGV